MDCVVDTDAEHVDAINAGGLRVEGLAEVPRIPAAEVLDLAAAFDLALIMTPAYETEAAAQTARQLLKANGISDPTNIPIGKRLKIPTRR